MKQKTLRSWNMTNAAAVTVASTWYPMGESGAPTDKEREDKLPLHSLTFENLSSEPYDIIIDPYSPTDGELVRRVPDGSSFTIEPEDGMRFYNVICINRGALETAIGELKLHVRNY